MFDDKNPFGYQFVGNSQVLIINLSGTLNSESVSTLDTLTEEFKAKGEIQAAILNFQQVENLGFEAIPPLALFLKGIRDKKVELRICSLKSAIKEKLGRAGILRSSELSENTKAAIYSLAGNKQKVA